MANPPIAIGRGTLSVHGDATGNVTSFQAAPWATVVTKKQAVNGRLEPALDIVTEAGYEGSFVVDHVAAALLEKFSGGDDGAGFVDVGDLVFVGKNPINPQITVSITVKNARVSGGSFELISQGWLQIPFKFKSYGDPDIGTLETV
jgi:hypothetical protein